MKKTYLLIGMCAFATMASAASAPKDTTTLDNVVVYGTPKAPVELLPLNVSIITEKQLEQSTETSILPVLGNQVPGLFVTERGMAGYGVSEGQAGTVNIRGVGGNNKVLFMIDGQPQWASIFGHALPDTYTSSEVAKVEVVRGPSSMLYGSNAMGGSVNIITRHANKQGFNGSARMMFGSYATQKYGASLAYNNGKLNTYINATYERSNGSRKNSQYWLASQFASLQYRFSDHWRTGANVTLTETTPHNPGSVSNPLNDMWTKIFRGTAALFVNNNYDVTSGQIQFYYNWGNHTVDDGYSAEGTTTNNGVPRTYLFHSQDFNMGINFYQNIHLWTDNITSVGVDFQHWGGKSWNTDKADGTETPGVNEHVNEIAGYVMMQQNFANDLLSLNAGLRLQHSSQFGNVLVPQAGFILHPVKSNTIKFSWGKGFRSPNLRELYMYPPHNPDLKPEYLWNYELEVRQLWLDGKLDTGLSLFFIDGHDMIQAVPETNPITGAPMTNKNIGKFHNKGIEVDATYYFLNDLTFTCNYSYLLASENVLYAPKHKLFGELMYHPGKWEFSVESYSVWGLRTGGPTEVDYSLLNARAAYNAQIGSVPMKIFWKAENITCTEYETIYGFPMPPLTVMAGIEVRF